ncbi:kinase-like domain-containing protein [Lentinula raphanica]|uniref:Kinase-like domain-containing protein n=1 Tax=Lentinula raphanica TaxID=153919 RepID=A0AA38UI89_9AGAR|nr:kinase-like domain-containing protein [Lentinula raphanica]KAJ3820584.1 kinase-like domain-containing protein [Lentinula raphanica]KAJ3841981.1 kinase-like domain-containing protein [Lentinula raphanica]KAJ3973765.1 kinase-like domain-containing protein [Lentinula raphanica]
MSPYYRTEVILSLGKSAAEVVAAFAPVPGLYAAAGMLCAIMELTENVIANKREARQLRDRCHTLLQAAKESSAVENAMMNDAFEMIQDTLAKVKDKMEVWVNLGRINSFLQQNQIKEDIKKCHEGITDCLTHFQVISHTEIHHWQEEFAANSTLDHQEVVALLSDVKESQNFIQTTTVDNNSMLREMMALLQSALQENKNIADRTHNGLASNLYELQQISDNLLPNMNLQSGEVVREGNFPVSGTAAMDIYKGRYLNREDVAIKVVRAVNSNEASKRRFMREVKVWNDLWIKDRGRHILPFYGFCQTDGPFPYMVSPWQSNGTALHFVKKYDAGFIDYRRMFKHIAVGVQVLHDMNIIHGDIKASNIMISPKFEPLLADFGLSRIVEDITGIPFTQSRGVSDSYRWFAPEVCKGQGVLSTRSDVYALGMTILELLTHQQPYHKIKHTTEVVIRREKGELPERPCEPRVQQRGLDDQLWKLLEDCWKTNASERPKIHEVIQRMDWS